MSKNHFGEEVTSGENFRTRARTSGHTFFEERTLQEKSSENLIPFLLTLNGIWHNVFHVQSLHQNH